VDIVPIDSQSAFPIESNLAPRDPAESVTPLVDEPVDPNNPRWGLGGAFLVWVASIVLLAVIPFFFLVPYAFKRGLDPSSPDFAKSFVALATADPTGIFLQILALLPSHLLTFALVWALVTRFGKYPFLASLGWGWSGRLRFWGCVGLGVALFAVGTVVAKLLGADQPTPLDEMINSSPGARYLIAGLAVLTAPFVEEFIYRGVLYAALQKLVGVKGAVVLVLALFTLIHVPQYWPNYGVIAAVGILSISLTVIRAYTGRLLPCIVIHFVFNGITSIILLVEPHLPKVAPASEHANGVAFLLAKFLFSISGL
jgi:membrane protease YdiL (CAAX protease family)